MPLSVRTDPMKICLNKLGTKLHSVVLQHHIELNVKKTTMFRIILFNKQLSCRYNKRAVTINK